jgi:cytochrome c
MEMVRNLLAAAMTMGLAAGPALAQDDLAAEGEKVFRKCGACHQVGEGAENKVGPELNGVIGRTAGSLEGFKYSDAMIEAGAGGLVWDEATLKEYLENPRAMVKGTKMAFAGLKKEEERAAVIAYLASAGAGGS